MQWNGVYVYGYKDMDSAYKWLNQTQVNHVFVHQLDGAISLITTYERVFS